MSKPRRFTVENRYLCQPQTQNVLAFLHIPKNKPNGAAPARRDNLTKFALGQNAFSTGPIGNNIGLRFRKTPNGSSAPTSQHVPVRWQARRVKFSNKFCAGDFFIRQSFKFRKTAFFVYEKDIQGGSFWLGRFPQRDSKLRASI